MCTLRVARGFISKQVSGLAFLGSRPHKPGAIHRLLRAQARSKYWQRLRSRPTCGPALPVAAYRPAAKPKGLYAEPSIPRGALLKPILAHVPSVGRNDPVETAPHSSRWS